MNEFGITIDGKEVRARPGQTIMQAADEAGIYIPRLCSHRSLAPHGSCRVCMVMVGGRAQPACIQPAEKGMIVENDTEFLQNVRRAMIDMLFVEGNHYCMFCEKSGECELQAMAYRLGILVPQYPYTYPKRGLDASNPEVFIDQDRCILCGRCVIASRDVDKKNIFGFVRRGKDKRLATNGLDAGAGETDLKGSDEAVAVCPVGTLMRKHSGYRIPIGKRSFDLAPIGSDIEIKRPPEPVSL
jgi:[NiFe] hydrogenase diaphorase moiety small subunit